MVVKNNSVYWLLTIILSFTFLASSGYWLIAERPYEQAYRINSKFNRLIEVQKYAEAESFLLQELNTGILDPKVAHNIAPFLFFFKDGYNSLLASERLLYSIPESEKVYKKIADLLQQTPISFTAEKKKKYLQRLKEIPKVNYKFLLKYNLNI